MTTIRTEYQFTLPIGFVDEDGTLLRDGTMRLSTAADDLATLGDPRVRGNPAYGVVVKLSRVITILGPHKGISTVHVERMYSGDVNYLMDFHDEINQITDVSSSGEAGTETDAFSGNFEAPPFRVSSIKR
jgi:hypothetical protein